jgi:hypothetical protein
MVFDHGSGELRTAAVVRSSGLRKIQSRVLRARFLKL